MKVLAGRRKVRDVLDVLTENVRMERYG